MKEFKEEVNILNFKPPKYWFEFNRHVKVIFCKKAAFSDHLIPLNDDLSQYSCVQYLEFLTFKMIVNEIAIRKIPIEKGMR